MLDLFYAFILFGYRQIKNFGVIEFGHWLRGWGSYSLPRKYGNTWGNNKFYVQTLWEIPINSIVDFQNLTVIFETLHNKVHFYTILLNHFGFK